MLRTLLMTCLILSAACEAAKLVILRGAPCAGKSSICRELAKQDSSWCAVSTDDVSCVLLEEMCREYCPTQTAIVKRCVLQSSSFSRDHFVHAVKYRNVVYKDDVSVEMRSKALQAIDEIRRDFDSNRRSLAREVIEKRVFQEFRTLKLGRTHDGLYVESNSILERLPGLLVKSYFLGYQSNISINACLNGKANMIALSSTGTGLTAFNTTSLL